MRLRFLDKESTPDESPPCTLLIRSYFVQGSIAPIKRFWPDTTFRMTRPSWRYRQACQSPRPDGLTGEVAHVLPPIVDIASNGNFIVQGARNLGLTTLGQMSIPDHETCVHVLRSALVEILAEV